VSDEQTFYEKSPSMFRNQPILFILCVVFVVVGWIILGIWWLRANNTKLVVTNERVRFEMGIFSKTIREIFLSDIRSVQIEQTFWQRVLLDTGSVEIASAGTAEAEIKIKGIPQPYLVKKFIDEHRRNNTQQNSKD
jgi:uncharacterized membrane protein YdbT with pleckstrin-like domain